MAVIYPNLGRFRMSFSTPDPSHGASLLDDRLAWPHAQWQSGGPWRLGEGLCLVGPGWHRLVRQAFALVAETPGAWVVGVKQKGAHLEVLAWHEDPPVRERLRRAMWQCHEASLTTCEGCGATVTYSKPQGSGVRTAVWRRHCVACTAVMAADGGRTERQLWELRAGYAWPAFDAW